MTLVIQIHRRQGGGELGFDWGPLAALGAQAGIGLLSQHQAASAAGTCAPPSGCFQCQIHGQGGIAGCIDAVSAQWINAAHARDRGELSNADLLALTQGILAGLSNEQLFTPQSDAYLAQAKSVFVTRVADIQALMAGSSPANTTVTPGTATGGSIVSAITNTEIGGVPLTTFLACIGVGLSLYTVLTRK